MPKVSVLIPMYNSGAFLAEAYESVLAQTFADFEIVILDDASTDDSVAIIESYKHPRTRIVKLPKAGYVPNLNIGLDLCDSQYVARFDSDDVMMPERLALQVEYLDANPEVVACGCQAERIDATGAAVGKLVYDCEPAVVRYRLLLDSPMPHPGTMYRRQAVLDVGKYREEFMPCEDYDLWTRLASRGRIVNLPQTLLRYRTHGANVSKLREQTLIANRERVRSVQMLELGLASTDDQARRYAEVMTGEAARFTFADCSLVREVWKRFVRRLHIEGFSNAELMHLRKWLRWQATAKAEQCLKTSIAKWAWYALAATQAHRSRSERGQSSFAPRTMGLHNRTHSILLVNWYANRSGGAESYTHDLALRLADRGHRLTVACVAATPELADRVRILPLHKPQPRRLPFAWRFESPMQYASVVRQVSRLPEVWPDIVLNSLPFAASALRERFPSASHVYFPHAMISPIEVAGYQTGFAARLAFALYSHSERNAILQSGATVRFTEHNRALIERFYRLPKSSRFAIIPAAVEVPSANAKPASGGVRLLFVGRLVASKNVQFLIECLAELPVLPWSLDIVGDGPERKTLEDLARARALTDRIQFHGHQPDPSRFYKMADLFAFPSLLENFPLVLLEAMARGTPVLAFANDGVRFRNSNHELIRSEIEGTLVPDEIAFKVALERFLSEPSPLRRLGENARTRVLESHSWPIVLQQWDDLFDRLRGL